ncbi:S-layer family protein [Phormidium sp. LEGE 05292]|uniref:beta strand repeat-containing protein n=1 Tax=[Phormidium] sp. LEGE 05292 TaxID=767427 RepID=UPI0018806F8D|nr:S-layer family protein [Phormidium sp. LEGE 05292]MBE9228043.1 S-layer family protein [Phormidium sp. LEGE 05292]
MLSINVPIGLQYGKNPGEIRIQGKGQNLLTEKGGATGSFDSSLNPLEVKSGKTLTIVGGNVIIDGGILQAPGGRVEIGGLAGEGTVGLNADGSLSFPQGVVRADVSISKQAGINVIGSGGGSITINAGNLNILGQSLLRAGIAINTGSLESLAGDITIDATGGITISSSRIENNVNSGASGSGNIYINAGGNFLGESAQIDSSNLGTGNAGNVLIIASDNINIQKNSQVFSDAYGANSGGTAGYVYISGEKSVNISNSIITAESYSDLAPTKNTGDQNDFKQTGNIWINSGSIALDSLTLSTSLYGSGVAGNVYLTATDNINIGKESTISSDAFNGNTSSEGTAGTVYIKAGNSFNLTANSSITADSVSSSNNSVVGGLIYIEAPTVNLLDGARLSTNTYGSVTAGDITINASDTFTIANSTISSQGNGTATGSAGNISIDARSVFLSNNAQVDTSNYVSGNAGNVEINAANDLSVNNSKIYSDTFNDNTNSGGGFAGYISLTAGNSITVANNSNITAESYGSGGNTGSEGSISSGNSGNIDLTAQTIALSDNTTLSTNTYGSAPAGNITIKASNTFTIANSSTISSQGKDGATGSAGTITIDGSNQVSISNSSITNTSNSNIGDGYGNITIRASQGSLLFDQATIDSTNTGSGYAGDIILNARDRVEINQSNINSNGNYGTISIGKNRDLNEENFSPRVVIVNNSQLTTNNKASKAAEDEGIDAGAISIDAIDRISLVKGSSLQTLTNRKGNAGSVTITSEKGEVSLERSAIFSTVEPGGKGKGGNIEITAKSVSVTGGAQLTASTSGTGNAGSVKITASDVVSFAGVADGFPSAAFSSVAAGGQGNGGNIEITAKSVSVTGGAGLTASTSGTGDAGSVKITASDVVSFDGFAGGFSSAAFSMVESEGKGKGGGIEITAKSVSVTGGAALTASTRDKGEGDAGSVKITASDVVSFDGGAAFSTVEPGGKGKGGNIEITAKSVSVTGGAALTASTRGTGDGSAGNITINGSKQVSISNSSITNKSEGDNTNDYGNITIRASQGSLLLDQATIDSTNTGSGYAGDIILNARDRVEINQSNINSNGNYGTISIGKNRDLNEENFSPRVVIVNNSNLTTNNQASLAAENVQNPPSDTFSGDISIYASDRLSLVKSNITANATRGVEGGNIELDSKFLQLRQTSRIATNASGTQVNGGNITIKTDILAASENSDISANSKNAFGGNVKINAKGIFGLQPRTREELQRLLHTNDTNDLDPRNLPTNDITATGATNSSSGNITIFTSAGDPTSGLVDLPAYPIDATSLVASTCRPRGGEQGKFIFTGRGGLPSNPNEIIRNEATWMDLREITLAEGGKAGEQRTRGTGENQELTSIVEAQGWMRNSQGQVVLVADTATATSQKSTFILQYCHE